MGDNRSAYRSPALPRAKTRTPTIATVRVTMCGCNAAALISQAAQAMRPMPLPRASTPRLQATRKCRCPWTASDSSLFVETT